MTHKSMNLKVKANMVTYKVILTKTEILTILAYKTMVYIYITPVNQVYLLFIC